MEFDDGDIMNVTEDRKKGRNVYTESEYWESTKTMPPPAPSRILQRLSVDPPCLIIDATNNSPAELFQKKCNTCSMCQLENCGRCDTCRRRELKSNDTTLMKEICLRKVSTFYSTLFNSTLLIMIHPFHSQHYHFFYRCVLTYL